MESFPLKSLDLWLHLGNSGPFSIALVQHTMHKGGPARKCLQVRAFPLEGKREQAQKTGAEAKISSEINLRFLFLFQSQNKAKQCRDAANEAGDAVCS